MRVVFWLVGLVDRFDEGGRGGRVILNFEFEIFQFCLFREQVEFLT